MFDKRKYLSKQPKYCKYCGSVLSVNFFSRRANERTGKIERISILVRCSNYMSGSCSYFRWEDDIKDYKKYAHKLPERLEGV